MSARIKVSLETAIEALEMIVVLPMVHRMIPGMKYLWKMMRRSDQIIADLIRGSM